MLLVPRVPVVLLLLLLCNPNKSQIKKVAPGYNTNSKKNLTNENVREEESEPRAIKKQSKPMVLRH